MPTPRSHSCARCGHPKSDSEAFNSKGKFADGTPRLSSICKKCLKVDEESPERREQKRAHNEKRRRAQGIPERSRGSSEFCPEGHRKSDNLRPGRYDCAVCHRERQRKRNRDAGAKPRHSLGETWSCDHDVATSIRYAKGKPKGCKECHREKQRLIPYNPDKRRDYVMRNREAVNAYRRSWRAANRPDVMEFSRGGAESIEYGRLIERDPCVYCGEPSEAIDHVRAVTRGGTGDWSNMAPICTSCNSSKNNKDVLQFLMYRLRKAGASR